jgi:hypothetical protein
MEHRRYREILINGRSMEGRTTMTTAGVDDRPRRGDFRCHHHPVLIEIEAGGGWGGWRDRERERPGERSAIRRLGVSPSILCLRECFRCFEK